MTSYNLRPLGDFIEIKHGFAFRGEFFGPAGPYALLTPGNFHDAGGFKARSDQKRYDGPVPNDYVLAKKQLVVAMTEQAEGLLGSSAFVPSDDIYLHNQRVGLVTLRENVSCATLAYIHYALCSREVRQQIRASATGTKIRHTSPTRICAVLIPDIGPSNRVAAGELLSAYDDLIGINRGRIAVLESMARELFEEWFIRFHFPGHETAPIEKRSNGPIPAGWRYEPLHVVARTIGRSVNPAATPNDSVAHFSLPAFDDGRWPVIETGEKIRSNKLAFSEPAVLIAKLNPHIPRVWPVLDGYDAPHVASTEFVPLAPIAPFTPALLYACVAHPAFMGGSGPWSAARQHRTNASSRVIF